MGANSNSTMSPNSRAKNFLEGEKDFLSHKGKDTEGITELFQYHDVYLSKNEVKLTYSDKFFKEVFRPMHLMNFKLLNKILDQFVVWCED